MVSPLFRFLRSPATNGGVAPSRPIMRGASREAELQRELDVLYAERAALARQERAAALNLCRLQDSLDALSNEITRRARTTRDVDLQTRRADDSRCEGILCQAGRLRHQAGDSDGRDQNRAGA
jgi:hypothetical protein